MNYDKTRVLRAIVGRTEAFFRSNRIRRVMTNKHFAAHLATAGRPAERYNKRLYARNVDVAAVQSVLAMVETGAIKADLPPLLRKLGETRVCDPLKGPSSNTLLDALGVWSLTGQIEGLDVAVLLAETICLPVQYGIIRVFPDAHMELLVESAPEVWVEATDDLLREIDAAVLLGAGHSAKSAAAHDIIEWIKRRRFWSEAEASTHQTNASQSAAFDRSLAQASQEGK